MSVPALPISLRAVVGGIGLVVALLCGLAGPVAYATFGYFERAGFLSFKVHLNANRLAKYIYGHEKLWQYQRVRLAELIEPPRDDNAAVRQRVFDGAGTVVLEEGPQISGPVLRRGAPIFVKGVVVGRIEAEESLVPFYVNVAWVALASFALGFAAYLAFRIVPLRVLDRTLGELETQNTRFDAALNNMSQGLCMFDAQQRLVVWNERYLQMYGLTRREVTSETTFRQLLEHHFAPRSNPPGLTPDKFMAEVIAAAQAELAWTKVIELADGRAIILKNQALPGGGWVTTHEDVTELRKAEHGLVAARAEAECAAMEARAAHASLRDAFEVVPQGLVLFDAEDRYLLWNRNYTKVYAESADLVRHGARFEDTLRTCVQRGQYPDALGREEEWIAERLAGHARAENNHEQRLPNGRWARVEERRTDDGGSIGVRIDITELKQREQELQAQNLRFDTALNNMSQGLSMFDAEQRLVVCNERYTRLYGLPPELTRPGTTFQQILDHRIANRLYAVASQEDHAHELLSTIGDNLPLIRVVEFTDGRAIVVKRQPMAGGGWVATHEDITEQRRTEARIAHMAHHDGLTDLANRVLLRERLEETLERRPRDAEVAVLCMDLDRFKDVNDTLGHPMGDALLKAVAQRLRGCVRDSDIVARIGGDEFAILQSAVSQPANATALARRIIDAISLPYELEGHQVVLGTSVGIAVAPGDGTEPDQLVKNADLALYRAKGDGRGTYRFFEPGMDEAAQARRKLELDLRSALSTGAFELYYQPLVDLDRNEVSSFEALLRWNHPEQGLICPDAFIPLAEETGLIVPIGEWVLRQACAEAAGWPEQIKVAVNLSAVQFNAGNLVELVFSALSASRLAAHRLELEITETAFLENSESAFATLHRLRAMGVGISLDDFGIGYSSLSYLRQFPFSKIKIDRSFIRDMGTDRQSVAIIQAVIGLGASLDMATVAEGVETRDELDCLRAFGCTEVQGYYLSPPRPASEVAQLLATIRGKTDLAA
jgi:diguanylate cyclase (GGDEF)-like protein